ncbi:unnamed protein product [Musa hybrid cultivar]
MGQSAPFWRHLTSCWVVPNTSSLWSVVNDCCANHSGKRLLRLPNRPKYKTSSAGRSATISRSDSPLNFSSFTEGKPLMDLRAHTSVRYNVVKQVACRIRPSGRDFNLGQFLRTNLLRRPIAKPSATQSHTCMLVIFQRSSCLSFGNNGG